MICENILIRFCYVKIQSGFFIIHHRSIVLHYNGFVVSRCSNTVKSDEKSCIFIFSVSILFLVFMLIYFKYFRFLITVTYLDEGAIFFIIMKFEKYQSTYNTKPAVVL